MGASINAGAAPGPDFAAVFEEVAGKDGTLPFDRFVDLALYHPALGYYRRERTRVGFGPESDFFTASASNPVFGELIAAAAAELLKNEPLSEYTFVEIGPETAGGVLAAVRHPFASVRAIRVGEPLFLEGNCIVFSNEVFDAQPFRRFVFRSGGWRERGVRLSAGRLQEVEVASALPEGLPACAAEGYILDAPYAAAALAEAVATLPWKGLFLACDYGKTWRELSEFTPQGTARAYHRHAQSSALLERPGEQDLTCHICWDWLCRALAVHGFSAPRVDSQEEFLVRHAGAYLARVSQEEAWRFSGKKLSLLQLLHPSNLGQKFQVLHALRL